MSTQQRLGTSDVGLLDDIETMLGVQHRVWRVAAESWQGRRRFQSILALTPDDYQNKNLNSENFVEIGVFFVQYEIFFPNFQKQAMLVRQLEEEVVKTRAHAKETNPEVKAHIEGLQIENDHLTREVAILKETVKVSSADRCSLHVNALSGGFFKKQMWLPLEAMGPCTSFGQQW